jgi:hypothetical protein
VPDMSLLGTGSGSSAIGSGGAGPRLVVRPGPVEVPLLDQTDTALRYLRMRQFAADFPGTLRAMARSVAAVQAQAAGGTGGSSAGGLDGSVWAEAGHTGGDDPREVQLCCGGFDASSEAYAGHVGLGPHRHPLALENPPLCLQVCVGLMWGGGCVRLRLGGWGREMPGATAGVRCACSHIGAAYRTFCRCEAVSCAALHRRRVVRG